MRSFAAALESGSPDAFSFVPDFRDPRVRALAVDAAAAVPGRDALIEVLARQDLPRGPLALANLARLAQPNAVAVVTGQQAGLFGGPLLSTYKLLSAVANARALEAEFARPVVPVFWLQNEDHDFVEIAEAFVPARSGELLRVAVADDPALCRVSVAHRTLPTSGLEEAVAALAAALHGLPAADEVLGELRRFYAPGAPIAGAFVRWFAERFEPWGVVFVDSRDAGLARLMAPLHAEALRAHEPLSQALLARGAELHAAGFATQVHVRPGAPLAFFHPDGPEGPRFRMEAEQGALHLVGREQHLTLDALLALAADEPRMLSSSALLRPLLQDQLLPTVAYVGGPAELAYFAQLGPLYQHLGRPMPLVLPRARFRVVEDRSARLLEQLALSPDALSRPRDELLAELAARDEQVPSPNALREGLLAAFKAALESAGPAVLSVDATLSTPLGRLEDAVGDNVGRFVQKYERAWRAKDQLAIDRLDRLLALLQPGGVPQERVHGLPYYLARYPHFLTQVLDQLTPFSGRLCELRLSGFGE